MTLMFESGVILLGENRCQSLLGVKGLNDMYCKVYSPWTDFVCSFPSLLFLFKEVFGAFSVEKREKYNIMECHLVWKPANRLPFRRQEKSRNDGCLKVRCALSLPHCFNVTFLKNQSCPLFARHVMNNYKLINFGYLRD